MNHPSDFAREIEKKQKDQEALYQGLTQLIRRYRWSHWATLEFPPRWSLEQPSRAFRLLQAYVDSFTPEIQGPIPWFGVAEPHADGTLHLHVFLRGTEGIPIQRLEARWERRNGSAEIRVYDPARDAAGYSVKRIPYGQAVYEFSDGFHRAMRKLDRIDQLRGAKPEPS
jgi:hypothetical protein